MAPGSDWPETAPGRRRRRCCCCCCTRRRPSREVRPPPPSRRTTGAKPRRLPSRAARTCSMEGTRVRVGHAGRGTATARGQVAEGAKRAATLAGPSVEWAHGQGQAWLGGARADGARELDEGVHHRPAADGKLQRPAIHVNGDAHYRALRAALEAGEPRGLPLRSLARVRHGELLPRRVVARLAHRLDPQRLDAAPLGGPLDGRARLAQPRGLHHVGH